jgi:hypothetical protein
MAVDQKVRKNLVFRWIDFTHPVGTPRSQSSGSFPAFREQFSSCTKNRQLHIPPIKG